MSRKKNLALTVSKDGSEVDQHGQVDMESSPSSPLSLSSEDLKSPTMSVMDNKESSFASMTSFLIAGDECIFEGEGQAGRGRVQCVTTEFYNHDPLDLQDEISDLKFQNRKLSKEMSELKIQFNQVEETNFNLTTQRENLKKRISNINEKHDKVRGEYCRELDEAKSSLSLCEDKNYAVNTRIHRMEREFLDACEENQHIKNELRTARTDADVFRARVKDLEHELIMKGDWYDQLQDSLAIRNAKEEELKQTRVILGDLSDSNEKLRKEKAELEEQVNESGIDGFRDINDSFNSSISISFGPEIDYSDGITEVQCPFSLYSENCSLHAEITATLGMDNSLPLFSSHIIDYASIGVQTEYEAGHSLYISKINLLNLLAELHKLLEITGKARDGDELYGEYPVISVDNQIATCVSDMDQAQQEIVRRINEELAEFREQLKKSQEIFHAMSNSSQNVCVSQSCPLLAEEELKKPQHVTSSTQTDPENPPPPDLIEDSELSNLFENMSLDDAGSYRLAINLSTVVEETSDQETETSPTSLQKMMNSEKRGRPKLVKMANALEDEHEKLDADDVKSDNEYASAISSLPTSGNTSVYNSLERPLVCGLHVSNGAKDDDTCSTVSGGNTTYGSPISSPSSLAYWTPLEGSSSQDTITIPDGDKTPVNDDFLNDDAFNNDNSDQSSRPKSNNWETEVPVDNRPNNLSIGVIPDADLDRMRQNAYDAVARKCDKDAKVLPSHEWRTLAHDLDAKELAQFRKENRQEEGGDTEESGFPRRTSNKDLDEEAEMYSEVFPPLVEELFKSLDDLKYNTAPSETKLSSLSAQFEQLSIVFKTNHINLASRSELVLSKHEYSQKRMKEIYSSWKDNLRKLREHKTGDIHEIVCAMEDSSLELEAHSNSLSSTARNAGMLDYDFRAYKMIEVMILYVHIMKKLRENEENERHLAGNSEIPSKKAIEKLQNNNNNEKMALDDGILGEGQSDKTERCEDGTPKYVLQYLLAPKSPDELSHKSKQKALLQEKGPNQNRILTYIWETYDVWRRELHWPWSWDQTWKGIKQGFSIFIMIVGCLIIVGNVVPNVGADGECETVLSRFFSHISQYGDLSHTEVPHF